MTAAAADLTAEGNKRMKEDRLGRIWHPNPTACNPKQSVFIFFIAALPKEPYSALDG